MMAIDTTNICSHLQKKLSAFSHQLSTISLVALMLTADS